MIACAPDDANPRAAAAAERRSPPHPHPWRVHSQPVAIVDHVVQLSDESQLKALVQDELGGSHRVELAEIQVGGRAGGRGGGGERRPACARGLV